MLDLMTILIYIVNYYLHQSMEVALTLIVGNDCFLRTIESESLTLGTRTNLGNIVKTKYHILRRHGDRSTICRIQDIMALEHQNLCFQNGLI